jgi:hypothetical protein
MTANGYLKLLFATVLLATGMANLFIQPGHWNEWPRWLRAAITTTNFAAGLWYLHLWYRGVNAGRRTHA